jgi:hypothetical protein
LESEPGNHVVGTSADDTLQGTEGNDVICGLDGNDVIVALGGNDLATGGIGDDSIKGGAGSDVLQGGDQEDELFGAGGKDALKAGLGDDSCNDGPGTDPPLRSCEAFAKMPLVSFAGTGQQSTAQFGVVGGLTLFDLKHDGQSNFIVWLLDRNGDDVDLLANEIGPYQGEGAIGLPPGPYLLDIDADGSWSVEVQQLRAHAAKKPRADFSGQTPEVVTPLQLDGRTKFTMSHSGDSNFIVWLLDDQGGLEELLANEIGPFQGSTTVGLDPGKYWVEVEHANGPWTISVT